MIRFAGQAGLAATGLVACSAGGSAACIRDRAPSPSAWRIEAEDLAARVVLAGDGSVEIDSSRGVTLWYARSLVMPVHIAFEAKAVAAGGPNDQVSDLNAFWMATDPAVANNSVLTSGRHGRFEDYDGLATYYVGIGGNRNTTVRMRRYVAQPGNRPLIAERSPARSSDLLHANRWTRIVLTADRGRIAVARDGRLLFAYRDAQPYRQGWFAFRTTQSHWRLRHVTISAACSPE